jgi:hypothetical protein
MSNPSNSAEIGITQANGNIEMPDNSQRLPAYEQFARTVQWAKLNHKEENEA